MATFNIRYSSNTRTIKTGAEIAQILRKAAERFEPVKFFKPEVDEGGSLLDEGYQGRLSLRGFQIRNQNDNSQTVPGLGHVLQGRLANLLAAHLCCAGVCLLPRLRVERVGSAGHLSSRLPASCLLLCLGP